VLLDTEIAVGRMEGVHIDEGLTLRTDIEVLDLRYRLDGQLYTLVGDGHHMDSGIAGIYALK